MNLSEIAASLTPEQRAEAPRSWQPNGVGALVRVIDPDWLRWFALRRDGLAEPYEPPVRMRNPIGARKEK